MCLVRKMHLCPKHGIEPCAGIASPSEGRGFEDFHYCSRFFGAETSEGTLIRWKDTDQDRHLRGDYNESLYA